MKLEQRLRTRDQRREDALVADLERTIKAETHQFIFVDDGGAGRHRYRADILVQDHLTYTAVFVRPEALRPLHEAHEEWLAAAREDAPRVQELHVTRLINPKRGHPWWPVRNIGTRVRHLNAAANSLLPHINLILHGHIGKEQYEDLIHTHRDEFEDLYSHVTKAIQTQRGGLECAFHTALGLAVRETSIPSVIIQDEGKYRQALKHQYDDSLPIWQGAVIYHPSHAWPGIQVADLASATLNRLFRIKDKRSRGEELNGFDNACEQIAEMFQSKLTSAWNL